MRSRGQSMLLVGVAIAALAVPLTIQSVGAQDPPPNERGQGAVAGPRNGQRPGQGFPGPQGQGFPGQPGPGMMGMMGGGGGATMVVAGQFLYILRGNQLLKVQKETLKVVAQGELPMPEMRFGPGGGQERPVRTFGGGGAPPPPPPPPSK